MLRRSEILTLFGEHRVFVERAWAFAATVGND
jgi:hypothetical protein